MPSGDGECWQAGKLATVALPDEIDYNNAGNVRRDLLAALDQGAAVIVADMSATTFCDSAGVNALIQVFRRASAVGARLVLAVASPAVYRVFELVGIDQLIDVYPSAEAAVAAQPACSPEASPSAGDGDPGDALGEAVLEG